MLQSLIPTIFVFVKFATIAFAQDEEVLQVDDMFLTKEQQKLFGPRSRNGLEAKKYLWPDNTVNVMHSYYGTEAFRKRFESAAAEITEAAPCIKFNFYHPETFPYDKKLDVVFVNEEPYSDNCHSSVGYAKFAQRDMQLSRNSTFCPKPKMIHAILHILGFFHMDNSEDRDNYVTIDWGNIKDRDRVLGAFNVIPSGITRFGTLYDYNSIMHRGPYAASKDPSKLKTIIAKAPPGETKYGDPKNMGQREGMSVGDKIRLRSLYSCRSP